MSGPSGTPTVHDAKEEADAEPVVFTPMTGYEYEHLGGRLSATGLAANASYTVRYRTADGLTWTLKEGVVTDDLGRLITDIDILDTGSAGTATIFVTRPTSTDQEASGLLPLAPLQFAGQPASGDPTIDEEHTLPNEPGPHGERTFPRRRGIHRGPRSGFGTEHIERGRGVPFDQLRPKMEEALKDPNPDDQGSSRVYTGGGYRVVIEFGNKQTDGKPKGLITVTPDA